MIKADLLDKESVLEDAEIGDEDVILVEYKVEEEWLLTNKKLLQELDRNRCNYCKTFRKDLKFCQCKLVTLSIN